MTVFAEIIFHGFWTNLGGMLVEDNKLLKQYNELYLKYSKLEGDFTELVLKSPDICHYCKNDIECKGKDCEKYVEGRGCWDDKRCHHDWAWSCKDFDFGTCAMLESTPCNGCFKNNNEGFEWRGNV